MSTTAEASQCSSMAQETSPPCVPASGQVDSQASSGSENPSTSYFFENWLSGFQTHEKILVNMGQAMLDSKFREELLTIEHWFKILSEAERMASLYTLAQYSTQSQIRYLITVLQQMLKPEDPSPPSSSESRAGSKPPRLGLRPPSLNLPSPGVSSPLSSQTEGSAALNCSELDTINLASGNEASLSIRAAIDDVSWASMVNTPLVPMFKNIHEVENKNGEQNPINPSSRTSRHEILGMINPNTLNTIANAGLSTEAQILAVQLVINGIMPKSAGPTKVQPQAQSKSGKKATHLNSWRAPVSAKYPASALKSSGLRSSALKSAGAKSGNSLSSSSSIGMDSPRVEDFNPEMLKDIPLWLRSLRLHKYTSSFDGMSWQEIVMLDDKTLETKGVAALGARRRLLRTFEHVRKVMCDDSPSTPTPTPTTSMVSAPTNTPITGIVPTASLPHSAAPRSKLSVDSPAFTPAREISRAPHSAIPTVSVDPPANNPDHCNVDRNKVNTV